MCARPRLKRNIAVSPRVTRFSPRGIRGRPDEIVLDIEGLEAIRLADLDRKHHFSGAKEMGVSRQTYERILKRARGIVADGIVNGKIIKIGGIS
jgi:predicted DNA-binding protein (UPF0251 family)